MSTSTPAGFHGWQRRTVLFLAGQTVSLFGSSLVQYAIIWHITLSTSSGVMMTIATLCGFLPQIAISLFAGVWADRYNRRFLIMGADAGIALATLVLALLFLSGYREIWLLFLILGLRSIGSGIQTPAVTAFIPQIVPPDRLMRVNGVNGSVQSLVMLLAPAASAPLLKYASLESIFFIDVITAAAAIVILLCLKVPPHHRALQKIRGGYFTDLKNGITYAARHRFIRALMAVYAVLMFLVTPAAMLTPLMITRTFGDEVWFLTFNEIAFGAGAMAGGVLIAWKGGFRNRMYTIALAGVCFGVATLFMGLSPLFAVYLAADFAAGICLPFFNSPATVLLQEKVEGDMQGRIFSLLQIISSAAVPLGMALFGPLADAVPVQWLLIGTGALIGLLSLTITRNRVLREGGLPSEAPPAQEAVMAKAPSPAAADEPADQ